MTVATVFAVVPKCGDSDDSGDSLTVQLPDTISRKIFNPFDVA
jgi:hypothetical protein